MERKQIHEVLPPLSVNPVKKRDREATKQKLMETGLQVFSEFGYDGATTRLISQRSGVNESLIIRYFENKSGLFLAIVLQHIRRSHEAIRHSPQGETVEEEISNYLKFRLEQAEASRDFMIICFSKLATDSQLREEIDRLCQSVFEQVNLELEGRLKRFQKLGMIRKDVKISELVQTIIIYELGNKFANLMIARKPGSMKSPLTFGTRKFLSPLAGAKYFAQMLSRSVSE